MGVSGTNLAKRLSDHGYNVTELNLGEFVRGGGSAKALVLRLSDSRISSGLLAQK
jgi:ornithine--oxo-acid transaminase